MPEAQPDSNSIASQQIERVLLSILGLLAFRALADLAFGAAKLISFRQLFEEQVPNSPLPPAVIAELYGNLFASGVELVVAVSLILGVAGVQAFLARLRGTDSF
ncbi:MAG: hypothetical protein IPG34_06095 [Rhodocyclaceae bacterium]|nr:hypothetical protein [Rhodocyclaceae bacterium]